MNRPHPSNRSLQLSALSFASLLAMQGAALAQESATNAVQLETAVVGAKRLTAADTAKRDLDSVAGGTSQVKAEDVEKRRVSTNEDVLAFQPGVFAQSAGGSDGIKISIRGSAANRGANFFRSGILFLFDGLPVTGPGGTPYELFEPLGLDHTDILRGPNAFDLGAATLGGAINYATKTGYEADLFELRAEGGSFGYHKVHVASGQVIGNFDYYASLTNSHRDGFQTLTEADSTGVIANFGYRFNPDVKTRFYVRYRETENQVPGNLTRKQIEDDPTQANSVNVGFTKQGYDSTRIQPGSTWLANKTTFNLDDVSNLELGLVWHNYPISIESSEFQNVWGYTDISATARYTLQHPLFGRDSKTVIGLLWTQHTDDGFQKSYQRIPQTSGPRAGLAAGTLIRDAIYNGADRVLHASNDLKAADNLWVTTGLSVLNIERSTEVIYPQTNQPYSRSDWALAPRLGLRYQANPKVQFFGNVSRSVEPPNDWSILTTPPAFSATDPDPARRRAATLAIRGLDVKDQTATTFEIGTRGQQGINNWSLSLYHALVKNELLSVEVQKNPSVTAESNASPTIHQGIEAGLETLLWQSSSANKVRLLQSYTLNDFHFRDDPVFGKNELPGLPRHVYQAQLTYDHPTGFYAGLTVTHGSKAPVDYANSFYTKDYTLLGATFGYSRPKEGWSAYLDFRNITDEHYAATVSPVYNDAGKDNARSTPGDGFGVYAGIAYSFK